MCSTIQMAQFIEILPRGSQFNICLNIVRNLVANNLAMHDASTNSHCIDLIAHVYVLEKSLPIYLW